MSEIKFEIQEELGTLSESAKGWTKEVNLISWNGAAAKYDIRDWALNHEKTLTAEEAQALYKILAKIVE